jgi:hypothetical protein
MPIPQPSQNEEQNNFISRCMGDSVMNKEYPDQKQRSAICYSQFKRAKKKSKGTEVKWEDQSSNGATIIF